jgi:hypothetical protein
MLLRRPRAPLRRKTKIAVMTVLAYAFYTAQISAPWVAESAADLAMSMQDQWRRCLKDSYQVYERRTPSKNSAAEMAFQFCSVQEEELWSYSSEAGVSRNAFEQIKAAAKKALVGGK